jgi:hypothetical protein
LFFVSDIDECAAGSNGGCSHICINSLGSFSCNCPSLHYLSINAATCVYFGPPEPTTPTEPTVVPSTATATVHTDLPVPSTATTTVQTDLPTTIPPSQYQCGGILANDVGSFHSEHWPKTYPVNVGCRWNITLPNPEMILEIRFDGNTFGLGGRMPRCKKDWVKVYETDANQTVTSVWGPFCGTRLPSLMTTKTSTATIQFHSGAKHGNSKKGFKIYYQALEVCVPPPPPLIVQGTCMYPHKLRADSDFICVEFRTSSVNPM